MEWKDTKRKDLSIIPLMESLGFKPDFAYQDEMYKRTTPEHCPVFAVNFHNDADLHVWSIKYGWQTATLNDGGLFVNHKPYNKIEDFIETLN
jgi:hypothetical protein